MRSGIVAVVGRPNTGKSTLVNALVGEKVAIVSDKPQTTRRGVRGVVTTPSYQVVFVDTPGFHKPRTLLGQRLNDAVSASVEGVDAVVIVVDAAAGVGRGDAFVFERHLAPSAGPRFCAVNKIDALRHHELVPQLDAASKLGELDEIVPVSARDGTGVGTLLELLVERMREGAPLFPEDVATDQTLETRVAELVREKALQLTRQELPHSIEIVIDELEDGEELLRVEAVVLVERESQKGIVIGRGGEMLKTIGTRARKELEAMLGRKVYLGLRVKVLREWQRDPSALQRLGF